MPEPRIEARPFPLAFAILVLLLLLPLVPPEVHGESLAGAAALALLAAALTVREDPLALAGTRGVLLAGAWPVGVFLARSAEAPGVSLEPLAIPAIALAVGIAASAIRGHEVRERWAPGALAIAGTLVAARALYEVLWGLRSWAAELRAGVPLPDRELVLSRIQEGRAYAGFATPAALGAFLVLAFCATAGLAWRERGRWKRAAIASAAVVQLAGLGASRSLTAAGALLAAGTAALALRRPRGRRLVPAALGLGVLAALVAAIVTARGSGVLRVTSPDSPWGLRAGNARIALEMIGDHPWLGVGPGGYGEAFPRYRRTGDNESRHAHCLPLELGAECGLVVGALASAAFLMVFLGPLARARREDPPWRVALAVGLAAFALQNLLDFTALLASTLWVASIARGLSERDAERMEHAEPGPAVLAGSLVTVAFAAAVLIASGLAANAAREARFAVVSGDRAAAAAASARARRLSPWDPDVSMLCAQTLLDDPGNLDEARARLEVSTRLADAAVAGSPIRASARALRSRIRWAMGDRAGAYADLAEAARLYPLHPDYAKRRDSLESGLRPPASGGTP